MQLQRADPDEVQAEPERPQQQLQQACYTLEKASAAHAGRLWDCTAVSTAWLMTPGSACSP